MSEAFLQFVWQHQLIDSFQLKTITREPIKVIKIGSLNTDSGPDFFNAQIKIGDTLWVGDVEIHVKSSDWNKHKHQNQKSYNSVILHVVGEYDKEIIPEHGNHIPTAILPIQPYVIQNFANLLFNSHEIKCRNFIHKVDTFFQNMWFDRLVIERFESKAEHIIANFEANNSSWEETMYQSLARNFGFKTNANAFEQLAKSLPLKIIGKHKNNRLQIEALLFGQAGMLSEKFSEEYPIKLQEEYKFLQKKYNLIPIPKELWKFARMRPANFPSLRIAQFTQIIFNSHSLTSKILEAQSIKEISDLFIISLHSYWDNHFRLNELSTNHKKQIGNQSITVIIINTVIPFLFAYGVKQCNDEIKQRAVQFLDEIPSESNAIISLWKSIETPSHSAFRSQALIQLKNEYCAKGKCLQCQIGQRMITNLIIND